MISMAQKDHRYVEEAGDTTFYGKGGVPIVGNEGVSKSFMLGMLKLKGDLQLFRQQILDLQNEILSNPYFRGIPSVEKRITKGGFFLHAKDDVPEIRLKTFELIGQMDCRFEAVVARKNYGIFARKHNSNEDEFYADVMSHLLKSKLKRDNKLILTVAARGKSTRNVVLERSLDIASDRFRRRHDLEPSRDLINFDVQTPLSEPVLVIVDYLNWAIQRVFEKGETRFYDFVKDKIKVIVDVYDTEHYANWGNYYNPDKPITAQNKIEGPSQH